MATLILGTIGGAVGGPIGGFIGSTLGSLLDNELFGPGPIQGPRLSELRVPSLDEGSPAPWVQGPKCRVGGQLIWMGSASGSNKVEERKSTSGGKGGGRPKTVSYDYYISVAVAFARQNTTPTADADGKFRPIRKLWANGTLIYNADKANTLSASNIRVFKNTKTTTLAWGVNNKADQEEIIYEHQSSATAFQDAGFAAIVTQVIIAGFANAANNGTFTITKVETVAGKSRLTVARCTHTWKQGGNWWAPTFTDTSTCIAAVDEAAGAAVTFNQPLDKFDKAQFEDIRHYCGGKDQDGTTPQGADPTMTSVEVAGNVPGHRGTTYVVVKNLKITNWGGTIPTFEALVQEKGTRTVGEAISNIITRNRGLTAADIDVSAVTGNVLGLVMMGVKTPKSLVVLLMNVYDYEVQERASIESGVFKNRLVFFPKATADLVAITNGDRGARTPDTELNGRDLISVEQTDPDLLPAAVVVQFVDPDEDYQPGSATYRRAGAQTETQSQLSLPLTLTQSNALAVAKKVMWQGQTNGRLKIVVQLPHTYIHLAEADRISVSDVDGLSLRARVTKADRGANGLITVEALQEIETAYSEPATGETRPG